MVKFVENELLNIKTEVNDMWQLVYQQSIWNLPIK